MHKIMISVIIPTNLVTLCSLRCKTIKTTPFSGSSTLSKTYGTVFLFEAGWDL